MDRPAFPQPPLFNRYILLIKQIERGTEDVVIHGDQAVSPGTRSRTIRNTLIPARMFSELNGDQSSPQIPPANLPPPLNHLTVKQDGIEVKKTIPLLSNHPLPMPFPLARVLSTLTTRKRACSTSTSDQQRLRRHGVSAYSSSA